MKRIIGIVLSCLVTSIVCSEEAKTFWDDRERGYYFYEDPIVEEKQKEKSEPKPVATVEKPLTARQILRKDGEDMEELFAQMQLDPSPENIHAYIKKSREITARAEKAAKAYGDEMFFVPGLNTRPKGLYAPTVAITGAENERNITNKILANNKKYSLVFFMRSDCPYCKEFAPILKKVADETGFYVLPVSLDGVGLKEFPNVSRSNKLVEKAKVKAVPAVYLLDPKNDKLQAVSFGFKGYSDFREQFARAFYYMKKIRGGK